MGKKLLLLLVGLTFVSAHASEIRFSKNNPWLGESGEVINQPVKRIDVSKQLAGPIADKVDSDWTVAVWNFPAWNPGGKHWPELADGKPLRMPLLYDSTDPEVRYNGISYYRLTDPRVMDWQIKWMREAGINLLMFDWYPSESKKKFDNSPRHRHINDSIEVGFLRKDKTGGKPVKTNPYEKKIDFVAMWTNHGHAWIPEGTMEYACENFLNQPNYYRVDGKPLIIIHAPGLLREEHGGEGDGKQKMKNLKKWVTKQREIARSYGYKEIYLTLGDIQPQYSKGFQNIGFDGAFNYVTHAKKELETRVPVIYEYEQKVKKKVVAKEHKGEMWKADYETAVIPSMLEHWDKMYKVWGNGFVPTITVREDFRHWHVQPHMLYYHGCTPQLYGEAIKMAKESVIKNNGRKFITVGIWNEFYEDGYLEPDVKYGYEYLKQIRKNFDSSRLR